MGKIEIEMYLSHGKRNYFDIESSWFDVIRLRVFLGDH